VRQNGCMSHASSTDEHQHPVDPERVAHARERLLSRDDAARLSSILSLLADPTRTRVIYALDLAEELCVGDIALTLDLGEDAVGYALRILRTAGMVTRRKAGRTVYYRLADGFPEPLRMHCLRRLVEISDENAGVDDDD
jgi:ArsR family transcriptional regulator, lead/cadmium/zinc/bismuth-responsive transcriptional repressor